MVSCPRCMLNWRHGHPLVDTRLDVIKHRMTVDIPCQIKGRLQVVIAKVEQAPR
jgi:hypothetical protein